MTKTSFFKARLSPTYRQLNFLNLSSIFELEVAKFEYKFIKEILPILFYNYFRPASKLTVTQLDLLWILIGL